MPYTDPPEILAAALMLQATIMWVAVRFGADFWYTQRHFTTIKPGDRGFLSTGNRSVDRYLTISSIAIATASLYIISQVVDKSFAPWLVIPTFGLVVGTDVGLFLTVVGLNDHREKLGNFSERRQETFCSPKPTAPLVTK
ncbi:hypothetical protein [Microvirga massiliensis]|uniref:hypothetical protein n=1 Tax=Microvirga massiliensis TaxID=1033741 RepID=UPI00062B8A17|nr:hypothetical protein [Microvirga massiliensis]